MGGLEIEFVGYSVRLEPDETLTFGRAADLVIDEDNVHMHRRVGRFTHENDLWWIENIGKSIPLSVAAADGTGVHVLPQSRCPLYFGSCKLRFTAGRATYELDCDVEPPARPIDLTEDFPTAAGTVDLGSLPLNDDQRRLVACLAERHLLDPTLRHTAGWDLPSNQQVATRLGWTITSYNRKLDRLCARFARSGVTGLRGNGDRAVDRRERLVEHALVTHLITRDDLALLGWRDEPSA